MQYNHTVQQLQSDLQNQVKKVQENIANLTVESDQNIFMSTISLYVAFRVCNNFTYRYLPEPSQLMPTDS